MFPIYNPLLDQAILFYLDTTSLLRLARVNRYCRQLIDDDYFKRNYYQIHLANEERYHSLKIEQIFFPLLRKIKQDSFSQPIGFYLTHLDYIIEGESEKYRDLFDLLTLACYQEKFPQISYYLDLLENSLMAGYLLPIDYYLLLTEFYRLFGEAGVEVILDCFFYDNNLAVFQQNIRRILTFLRDVNLIAIATSFSEKIHYLTGEV